jgi:hypothetical protein
VATEHREQALKRSIEKWGRLKIAPSPADADLVLTWTERMTWSLSVYGGLVAKVEEAKRFCMGMLMLAPSHPERSPGRYEIWGVETPAWGDEWDPLEPLRVAVDEAEAIIEVRSAADANVQTSAGYKYYKQVGTEFGEKHEATMAPCRASVSANDIDLVKNIFVKLAADGTVTDVLVTPETNLAQCLRNELSKFKFSPPPASNYWVKLE